MLFSLMIIAKENGELSLHYMICSIIFLIEYCILIFSCFGYFGLFDVDVIRLKK